LSARTGRALAAEGGGGLRRMSSRGG